MNLFSWFSTQLFSSAQPNTTQNQNQVLPQIDINPASGLPMPNGITGLDTEGNVYGFNDLSKGNDIEEFGSCIDYVSNFDNDFTSCDISSSSFD